MRVLLVSLLLLCGCTKNHDELRAREAELDRTLAEKMSYADNLNAYRRQLDPFEDQLRAGLEAHPEARAEVDAIELEPDPSTALNFAPLPPESIFEGSAGQQLRLRIADTQKRLAQLEKILGEVGHFVQRKRQLEKKLAVLEKLKAAPQ